MAAHQVARRAPRSWSGSSSSIPRSSAARPYADAGLVAGRRVALDAGSCGARPVRERRGLRGALGGGRDRGDGRRARCAATGASSTCSRRRGPGRWTYHVVRCPSCGFLYRNPGVQPGAARRPLQRSGNYGKFLTGRYGTQAPAATTAGSWTSSRPCSATGRGRRLLDYGSGAGLFTAGRARARLRRLRHRPLARRGARSRASARAAPSRSSAIAARGAGDRRRRLRPRDDVVGARAPAAAGRRHPRRCAACSPTTGCC